MSWLICSLFFFFFNDTATTEIYTLSLHDALPIWPRRAPCSVAPTTSRRPRPRPDRKSTRLNSSHVAISYAVFCLKKKNKHKSPTVEQAKSGDPGGKRTRASND